MLPRAVVDRKLGYAVAARFRATLANDPRVIRAFVFVAQPRYDFPRFRVADRVTFVKTIGQRQYQDSERLLVFRIRPEDVQANTLGLGGLVEEPVAHRLLQSGGNGLRR